MKKASFLLALIVVLFSIGCSKEKVNKEEKAKMEKEYEQVISEYESLMIPAYREMSLQYFVAATNSTPENWEKYAKLEMKVNEILSNKKSFRTN